MEENYRPVSYQQTLGTKTERIRKEAKEQNQNSKSGGKNLEKTDANFPE
jgi:hypothetical protein